MIPKIIHYCWFGGNPLPSLALECIASWRKYLPDYEIWAWVEDGSLANSYIKEGSENADKVMGFDVNIIPYTEEAYSQKKYAFVSDYARFWIMYKYGGIYFDTDVEVVRPLDDIIARGNFMGFEMDPDGENTPGKYAPRYCFAVNPGLGFGIEREHSFIKKMIDCYGRLKFEVIGDNIAWYKTIVAYTTELLCNEGLRNKQGIQSVGDITVYPSEYFAPINVMSGKLHITKNTRTVHRYMGSWSDGKKSLKSKIRGLVPEWVFVVNNRIKRQKFKIK